MMACAAPWGELGSMPDLLPRAAGEKACRRARIRFAQPWRATHDPALASPPGLESRMTWIRCFLNGVKAILTRAGRAGQAVPPASPARAEPARTDRKPVAMPRAIASEATRLALREGFRSNGSAQASSRRTLTAIPATFTPFTPAASIRAGHGGEVNAAKPPAGVTRTGEAAKPRASASPPQTSESSHAGAEWLAPAPVSAPGPLDPPPISALMPSVPMNPLCGEVADQIGFGVLSGPAGLDLSPRPLGSAGESAHTLLGSGPSLTGNDVLGLGASE